MSGMDSATLSDTLAELEETALRMEALGPGDLAEAALLLSRAAMLRTALEEPLAALRTLSEGVSPDFQNSRQDS